MASPTKRSKMASGDQQLGFEKQVNAMTQRLSHDYHDRTEVLKNLDLFVLDNSLRETTVGQLRGHTLENKRTIFDQVSEGLYSSGLELNKNLTG